jgi:hypothetical protein
MAARTLYYEEYFDVCRYPLNEPVVSTSEVDDLHPGWQYERPSTVTSWATAIRNAHAELVHDLSQLRDNNGKLIYPYRIADRSQLRWAEMIYVEHHITENIIRSPDADKQFQRERKAMVLSHLNSIFIDTDDDLTIDESSDVEDLSIRFRR